MDPEPPSHFQPAKTVEKYFDQMQDHFTRRDERALSLHLKRLYTSPHYQFSPEKWKAKIDFSPYASYQNGMHFTRILQQIQQFQIIKLTEGKKPAFKFHLTILITILKAFEDIKEAKQFWICSPLRAIVRATKKIFMESFKSSHGSSNVKIDDLMNTLQRYKGSRNLNDEIKKEILPLIDNMQISILLVFHNYEQISRILKVSKMLEQGSKFINNFYFQKGKVALINEKMKEAEESLQKIQTKTFGQKRLVLKYLIPTKMFLGKMFAKKAEDENFPEYEPLIKAIISSDFAFYEDMMEKFQRVWIKRGIYLLMDKLRIIIWRNLIKKVSKAQQTNKINIQSIEKAVKMKGGKQKLSECICIISNLIYEGYLKGYIYQHEDRRVLVLSSKNPFPPLSTIYN